MINLKSPADIERMAESGAITAKALKGVLSKAQVGVSLAELDKLAESLIRDSGATPSFQTVAEYRFATCLNVNEGVVHGVPDQYCLKEGDVFSVDLGTLYQGWHTDSAWTVVIGDKASPETQKFLKTGELALEETLRLCQAGRDVSDLSKSIQSIVEGQGYSVSRDLVGHGVGKALHEDPQIPGFMEKREPKIELKNGMVLAIEVIYMMGESPIIVDEKDGWTISTEDGSIAALFEHTVAITADGPVVLTKWQ